MQSPTMVADRPAAPEAPVASASLETPRPPQTGRGRTTTVPAVTSPAPSNVEYEGVSTVILPTAATVTGQGAAVLGPYLVRRDGYGSDTRVIGGRNVTFYFDEQLSPRDRDEMIREMTRVIGNDRTITAALMTPSDRNVMISGDQFAPVIRELTEDGRLGGGHSISLRSRDGTFDDRPTLYFPLNENREEEVAHGPRVNSEIARLTPTAISSRADITYRDRS